MPTLQTLRSKTDLLYKEFLKPEARFKFREIKTLCKTTTEETEQIISDLKARGLKIVHSRLDHTFYLSRVPTPYSDQYDMSWMPKEGKIGIISDTHLCSEADRLDLVERAYDDFAAQGITEVLHAGDITDGNDVYKGHNHFVKVMGGSAQAVYVKKHYPKREGITTYYIGGNHDLRAFEKTGLDQTALIVTDHIHNGKNYSARTDMVYLGQYSRYITFPDNVLIHIVHPRGANAYAKSYAQQRRAREMKAETRPNLQISGHLHVFNFLKEDITWMLAMPGVQDETEFFIRQGYRRDLGYVILDYVIDKGAFKRLKLDCVELE